VAAGPDRRAGARDVIRASVSVFAVPPAGAGGPAPDRRAPAPGDLPQVWPQAWPSLWPAVARRAAFVAATDLLTLLGLAIAADPATQWWALLVPLALLTGPLTHLALVRHRARRAATTGRLDLRPDGLVLIRRRILPGWRPFARLTPDGHVRYLP
jgi:hypothetical protein